MHYTVLVLGNDPEALLAPYDENLTVAPYLDVTIDQRLKNANEHSDKPVTKEELIEQGKNDPYITQDEEGNLYSTFNPDGKWDWYQEGGRWQAEAECYGPTIGTTDWKYPPERLEQAREFWHDWVLQEHPEKYKDTPLMYKPEYYLDKYKTLENYLKANTYRVSYAILTPDGLWHEPGPMGWFSSQGSLEDELDFEMNAYDKYIRDLPADTPVTLVDCHI